MSTANRWADLKVRVISALVLIVLAAFEIYEGGAFFLVAIVVVVGAMIWELAGLTIADRGPQRLVLAAIAGGALLLWASLVPPPAGFALLALPSLALLVTPRRDRVLLAVYALAIMVAGTGFLALREQGPGFFLWLVLVVVACDTMGYFAGRLLGGPKFWPRISPKKTWSGTVAGWFGAALVGVIFAMNGFPWALAVLSPLIAFAGQMGDMAESWIKRRAGVKDSSGLIPGHGGVLDRFDALVGSMLALQGISFLFAGLG